MTCDYCHEEAECKAIALNPELCVCEDCLRAEQWFECTDLDPFWESELSGLDPFWESELSGIDPFWESELSGIER